MKPCSCSAARALTALELARRRPWQVAIGALAAGLALAPAPPEATLLLAAAAVAASAGRPAGGRGLCGGGGGLGGGVGSGAEAGGGPAVTGLLAAAMLLAGGAVGDARLAAIDAPADRLRDGASVAARAVLLTHPRPNAFGADAEVRLVGGPLSGARLLARIPRWARWPAAASIGAELAVRGRLRVARASASGQDFDFAAHLRRRGIAGELLLDAASSTGRRRGGLAGLLDRVRERAEAGIAAGLPRAEASLARGMVLGQDDRIAKPVRDDFRDSGLAHLLAASGQNVMLLAALALPALAAAGLGLRARTLALLGLIALYVPLAGAGPSIQRAGVMGATGLVALLSSRPASRWYALLLAAAITLAVDPRACGEPGWQLSFAAVAGILLVGRPLGAALTRLASDLTPPRAHPGRGSEAAAVAARAVADGAAITFAATLATAPLLGHHFDSIPLAGLPANLLALPAIPPAMWLGMLKAALGQLSALGAPVVAPAEIASGWLGVLARIPVAYVALLAERLARMPGGQLSLPLGSPGAVVGAYLVLAAATVLAARALRRLGRRADEVTASFRRLPRRSVAAGVAAAACAAALLLAETLAPPPIPGALTVRFLDVGQGDATLIQHPDGTAVLFDGGPPEAAVTRLLRAAGVRDLAVVVATHASRDHDGGLPEVLERHRVGLLLDGGDGARASGFRALRAAARAHGVRRVRAIAPLTLSAGALTITVLSPPPRPPGPPPEDPNPRAVVAVVSAGGFDLLLSADAESEALLALDLPDVDAMKVPHHGSADPGLPEVLERLRPELAAIEVGAENTYGHPAPETLRALERAGVPTYRTDRDGTITLSLEHGRARVATER